MVPIVGDCDRVEGHLRDPERVGLGRGHEAHRKVVFLEIGQHAPLRAARVDRPTEQPVGDRVVEGDREFRQPVHAVGERRDRMGERLRADKGVAAWIGQVQHPRCAADLDLFGARPELVHEARLADPGDAVDHHEADRGLAGLDEIRVRLLRLPIDDHQIGPLLGLDRTEALVPAQDLRRVDRRHPDDLLAVEHRIAL